MGNIKFYFDIASFYSALAAIRIARRFRDKSFKIDFKVKPVQLGAVFKATGQNAPPGLANPVKGENMWRDVERQGQELGYKHFYTNNFPIRGVLAHRVIIYLDENQSNFHNSEPLVSLPLRFLEKVYEGAYVDHVDVADAATLSKILKTILPDADTDKIVQDANTQKYKDILKANTDEAIKNKVFGAPTFICPDGELFWGNDRLMSAYKWADKVNKAKL